MLLWELHFTVEAFICHASPPAFIQIPPGGLDSICLRVTVAPNAVCRQVTLQPVDDGYQFIGWAFAVEQAFPFIAWAEKALKVRHLPPFYGPRLSQRARDTLYRTGLADCHIDDFLQQLRHSLSYMQDNWSVRQKQAMRSQTLLVHKGIGRQTILELARVFLPEKQESEQSPQRGMS